MQVGANLACYNFAMQIETNISKNDEAIISCIAEQGYVVIDDYFTGDFIASLGNLAKSKFNKQEMTQARTGKHAQTNASIRGDSIHWLDENTNELVIQQYFLQMQHLKTLMNRHFYMGLASLETHLAIYPAGAVYKKHLDQFSVIHANTLNTRKLSSILYLNEDWLPQHGGELKLYINETEWLDILPKGGRLVLFLSAEFWHEVLPATRERLSLTGWFRTREQQPING